ncbi:MAG: exodeoxyribonuclease VII small subunit [Candidatus Latescibacteria bacterium]|nr:exodeoxyribonuclease VII small subunit [Candidatus Latescibacterota bacterium]
MAEGEPTFEDALKQLESAVETLESGNLPLAEALRLFEEGLRASNLCRARLEEAKQRVEVLAAESGNDFRLTDLDAGEEQPAE